MYVRLTVTVKAQYKQLHTEQTVIRVLAYICTAIVRVGTAAVFLSWSMIQLLLLFCKTSVHIVWFQLLL
jgi:hypothetical protein